MYVKTLDLQNFRNYEELSLVLSPGTTIFYGRNAQGKTNILEALYLTGTTRSHRGAKDRDMIRVGCDESHLRMIMDRRGTEYRIDLHLRKYRSKGIAVNQTPVKRAADLFGIASFVFFSPEDLGIVKNGPSGRRKFLDLLLGGIDRVYLSDLTQYGKVLQERNALLKDAAADSKRLPELDVWDQKMAEYGRKIIRRRAGFIKEFRETAASRHSVLTGGGEKLDLLYEPNTPESDLDEKIFFNRDLDLRTGMTNEGPHRDDLAITSNGMDLRTYGSQGQQRTAALSLKLAEIEVVSAARKDRPVLLLDDVLSELDGERQRALLAGIRDTQTLITCTGLDDLSANQFHADRMFRVDHGKVTSAGE